MKPINLKIKGINSYVSMQEIDFSRLAENNIFGIFGETGSGKTTILDSIILALYGISDRDNLQNIINVNTKDAYIEFTFEMESTDGKVKRYFVRRDYKLRPSGLKAEAILNNLNTNKTIAEMPDNVNNAILDIIGIGKKEFTKCIALPQGEFDRFLSDTPAIRKKTLAKLFDLEQFGIILNEKLKAHKAKVSIDQNTLREKISVYQGISQDTIDKTLKILKDSDKQEKALILKLSKDKKLAEKIKEELHAKQELLDLEVNYSIKQSELSEINFIEKQIEYTEKYGEFSVLTSKYNTCAEELESLNASLIDNKKLIDDFEKDSYRLKVLIEENQKKHKELTESLNQNQLNEEKRRLRLEAIENLKKQKEEINKKLLETSQRINDSNSYIKCHKANLIDLNANYKKLETTIFDNMDIIDKLNNCTTYKAKQDFALFLTITRNKINPDSLSEVEDFNIYDEVTTAVHDMENYELGVRKEIGEILRDLHSMELNLDNLDEIKDEYVKANERLNKECDQIEEAIVAVKEKIASEKALIENLKTQVDDYNTQLEKLKVELNEKLLENKEEDASEDIAFISKSLKNLEQEGNLLDNEANKLNISRQQAIIDIEVATNNIENLRDKILDIQQALKSFSKSTYKEKMDHSLLLSLDEVATLKQKVVDFHKELNVLETNTLALREKTKDYIYTKDDYNNLVDTINANEEKLTELKVFINVNRITIDIQKQNLSIVQELQKDLDIVDSKMNAIEQLEGLLSGGALIDFVSEEYMGLITDFANTYVYTISKGKYLLNYDGDFNVIDNFNGGIKRSVKTLSGGERFIVSLSLALGISQSIAVNNNKNFNFFFIDEGFGNLSENYIEKVLQSFDALIKLNFTVGFITHVEKMQYYLNNRIIVTKENTDDGSKIEQFC